MRRIARLLPYIALLLVILIVIAFSWRAGPLRRQLRASIAEQLAHQTNRTVSIGDVSLSPTGQVVIRELAIRNKDGSALLIAPEAAVRLGQPLSLLSPATAASSLRAITLRKPEITLIRDISNRWNIEDLLKKRPGAPSRFSGDVIIEQGRVTVVDRARGATTTLEDVNLDVRQPHAGQVHFTVHARGAQNSFDALDATGEVDSNAKTTDVSGKIADLDMGYTFARLPEIGFMKITAGRASITGTLKLTRDTPMKIGAGATGEAEITAAEVDFPWLRRPLQNVKGTVQFADGALKLDGISGTCAGAPFEAGGAVSEIQSPQLDVTFKIWDLRYPELKKIMPSLVLPATLLLPSPLTIQGHATGPAADPTVKGSAQMKVLKFHLIPWHDAISDFTYTKGKLRLENLHAHGSPRQLNADIDVQWGQGAPPVTTARFSLAAVPVADLMKMIGVKEFPLEGTASFTGTASLDRGQAVRGQFTVKNAVVRGMRLGEVAGEIDYSDRSAIIRNGRVKGRLGSGKFSASIKLPDSYTLEADLARFDLSALSGLLGQPQLSGRFPLTIRASGPIRGVRISGAVKLGPGLIQGRAFESVDAAFDITPERVAASGITARFPSGAVTGALEVRDWQRRKQQAPISGRFTFEKLALGAWIPPQYGLFLTSGSASGSVELSGTAGEPVMVIELTSLSVVTPRAAIPSGTGTIRYQAGTFTIEKLDVTEALTHLTLTAEATPTGTVYTVAGDQVELGDLAGQLRKRYGLEVSGKAKVHATVWGDLSAPHAEFRASADAVLVNGLTFSDISISGRYADGALQIDAPPIGEATLWQGGSSVVVHGTVGVRPDAANDLTIELGKVEVLTMQSLVDRANWHLSQAGVHIPWRSPYFLMPRPFGGILDSTITVTGTGGEPYATAGVAVSGLSFGNRQIEEITGTMAAAVRLGDHRTAALESLRLNLRATQGPAYASLSGNLSTTAPMSLQFRSGNVDLALLRPWLQYFADLNGLALAGTATVNFDVGGTMNNPGMRGDALVENLTLGPLKFENVVAYPITLRDRVLTIENVAFSDYPMVATGTARVPLDSPGSTTADLSIKRGRVTPVPDMPPSLYFDANLYLRGRKLILSREPPAPGMPPRDGLREYPEMGKLAIQGEAEFEHFSLADWQRNRFDFTAEMNGLEVSVPGMIEGTITGALALRNAPVTGRLVLATPDLVSMSAIAAEEAASSDSPRASVQMRDAGVAEAVTTIMEESGADIEIEGDVNGTVSLSRQGATVDRLLEDIYDATGIFWWRTGDGIYHVSVSPPPESRPIVFSRSTLSIPSAVPTGGTGMPFMPDLRIRVEVGDGVEFRYGAGSRPTKVKVDPGGYLYIGGPATPEGIILAGEAYSHDGTLSFPNGALTLRSGVAKVSLSHRQELRSVVQPSGSTSAKGTVVATDPRPSAGWGEQGRPAAARPPHVWISAEADGRIGDYYVSLNPIGQVFPPPPGADLPGTSGSQLGYSLNAVSIPRLDEAYVMALLAGPVISPAIGPRSQDITRLLSSPGSSGALGSPVTGFALPTFGSLSPASPQLSLAVGFQGPVQLRVGERLFRRVLISYLSPLGGVENRSLTVTYEVTPRWSFGWGFNSINQVLWQVQGLFPF